MTQFRGIINKMASRLAQWKASSLSKGGTAHPYQMCALCLHYSYHDVAWLIAEGHGHDEQYLMWIFLVGVPTRWVGTAWWFGMLCARQSEWEVLDSRIWGRWTSPCVLARCLWIKLLGASKPWDDLYFPVLHDSLVLFKLTTSTSMGECFFRANDSGKGTHWPSFSFY